MASTSATEVSFHSGYETVPGIKIGAYGAAITNLKAYTFTGTDTGVISATSTERSYTINGLSTNDFVLAFGASTGFAGGNPGVGNVRVGASNTLNVNYSENGTSTTAIPGPFSGYVVTAQIISLASSTTT